MIKKPVTAQDAAIKKILDSPANEVQGAVSYTNPQNNTMYKYTPTVNTSVQDAAIQKILQNPKNEINGGVSYEKGNTRYSYTPSYTQKGPQSPSYTQTQPSYRDIASEMNLAASMGEWDKFSSLANERMRKIAQNGGNDGGVTTNDLVNQLRAQYGKSYNNYQQMQNIQKLLGDVSSPYDSLYQSLLQKYQDYTFDKFKNSSAYQSMKDLYEMNGKNAMKDVLGEIAARTGGYASSYATAAAQEQYQSYMAQLAALAEQMYGNERNNMLSEVNQMGNRLDSDISRRQATNMNLYNALRQLTLDQKAEEDAEAQREATAQEYARDSIINALSNGVDIDLLDQGLLEQSGLSYMDLLAYEKIYSDKAAQQQFENSIKQGNLDINRAKADASIWKTYNTGSGRSSGGGGGSIRSPKTATLKATDDTNKWADTVAFANKYSKYETDKKGNKTYHDAGEDYVKEHYKDLGYSSQSAALAGYKNYKTANTSSYSSIQDVIDEYRAEGFTKAQIQAAIKSSFDSGQIRESEYRSAMNILLRM